MRFSIRFCTLRDGFLYRNIAAMSGYVLSRRTKAYLAFKRCVDVFGSILGLIVLSPLMLFCALMVKLTSKGPAIFKQKRVGKDLKEFDFYKFRSMRVDAPNVATSHLDVKTQQNMVTKWGRIMRRTSLDELPQLFNILKGDMSFVGPRPCQPRGIEDDLIDARLSYIPSPVLVRPGLSGYAQIYLHRDNDCKKKAEYDAYYVAHLGLWLDIKIFFWSFLCLFGYTPGR